MTNGILLVNKPTNYTSRDIVNIVSKIVHTKKVGHTGTLDPLATGVLVLTIGKYTKLCDMLTSFDKEYIAQIKLGVATDTLDITGNVLQERQANVSLELVEKVLKEFIGPYHMQVPKYSAIKVKGKKLYDYARQNEDVELPYKDVVIYNLELLSFKDDLLEFKAHVSKGTYIRSLIRDICLRLNTLGTMLSLTRVKQGTFKLEDTYTLEDIQNGKFKLENLQDILNIREYKLSKEEYEKVKNGNQLKVDSSDEYLYLTYNSQEIALYQKRFQFYKCYVMLI